MDPIHYRHLLQYLDTKRLPSTLDEDQKRKLVKKSEFYEKHEGLLYKKDRRKDGNLLRVLRKHEIDPILFLVHTHPLGGHFNKDVMFEKTRDTYFWPQMYHDIRKYAQTCDACQRRTRPHTQGPLHPIPVSAPFFKIGIDFVGPLPRTPRLNRYIIVATDFMTRWPEARAVEKANAQTVVEFLYEDILCRHGCPDRILSDRGTHFRNEIVKLLLEKLKIRQNFSTPYHPRTNGLVERFNRTLCEALGKLVTNVVDWDLLIPSILFAYRTARNSTTRMSPFFLVYGREARQPIHPNRSEELLEGTILQRTFELINEVPTIRSQVVERIHQKQENMKVYHDKKHRISPGFDIGDKVLLEDAKKRYSRSDKFAPKCTGPYYVHDKLPNDAYKLRTLEGKVISAPFNLSLLKKYYDRDDPMEEEESCP